MHLTPANNKRNVWFNEYWEELFKCHLPNSTSISKFASPCVEKCPIGFALLGNSSCYHFARQARTWSEASRVCEAKSSELVNILERDELRLIHDHLVESGSFKAFGQMHVRLRSTSANRSASVRDIWEFNGNYGDGGYEGERGKDDRLKLKLCHLTKYYSHFSSFTANRSDMFNYFFINYSDDEEKTLFT
jgi:hypothetical protein